MPIRVVQANVLDAKADALMITAAPEQPGKGKRKTDILGSVGAQLLRRIGPEAAEDLADQLDIPMAPGSAQVIDVDPDCGLAFRQVLVVGALSHLPQAPHKAIVTAALTEGLRQAQDAGLSSVALAVPKGGWRISMLDGLLALVTATQSFPGLNVEVHCLTPEEAQEVGAALRTLGVR